MDEEKKPEASGEELEQLGPYLLHEQVEQSHDSPVELYLATHETSGATALVRKHAAQEGAAARKDWRVRLGCWASRGYSALEVEHTAWARAQDRQSAESLLLTLESVFEEVQRMAHVIAAPQEPRLRWRLSLCVVGAATVCALLFALVRPAPLSHEVPTAAEAPSSSIEWGFVDTIPPKNKPCSPGLCQKSPTKGRSALPARATPRWSSSARAGYLTS